MGSAGTPRKKTRLKMTQLISDSPVRQRSSARISDKKWLMAFSAPDGFDNYLERFGRAPLPPYIKRKKSMAPDQTNRPRALSDHLRQNRRLHRRANRRPSFFNRRPSHLAVQGRSNRADYTCMSALALSCRLKRRRLKIMSWKRNILRSAPRPRKK